MGRNTGDQQAMTSKRTYPVPGATPPGVLPPPLTGYAEAIPVGPDGIPHAIATLHGAAADLESEIEVLIERLSDVVTHGELDAANPIASGSATAPTPQSDMRQQLKVLHSRIHAASSRLSYLRSRLDL